MICNQKKSKVLKILVKIWLKFGGVGLRKYSKSEKKVFAQKIIEWAEK